MTPHQPVNETATYWRYISNSLDRLVTLALEIDPDGFNWQPPVPETNSVATLAFHTLGNVEENILETLCGQSVNRDRASEFATAARSKNDLRERWESLRPRLEQALAALPENALAAPRTHPRRGTLTGREILIVVVRHAAEHLGQASDLGPWSPADIAL